MDSLQWKDLGEKQNSLWYEYNDSDTVFIFVHGVHANSKNNWLYKSKDTPPKQQFWPDLIRSDERFKSPAVFLASYYTAFDAGRFGIPHCADEVFDALKTIDVARHRPVMDFPRIIFVAHSMGGIITRYILTQHWDEFATKEVGVALIASPSRGSEMADRVQGLTTEYAHKQVIQMMTDNDFLETLHRNFRDLVNARRIPQMIGAEACEHHFFIHNKWLPLFPRTVVVTEESAGQYFGAVRILPGTDHFSSVQPDNLDHPAHQFLVRFWLSCSQSWMSPDGTLPALETNAATPEERLNRLQMRAEKLASEPSPRAESHSHYFFYISEDKLAQIIPPASENSHIDPTVSDVLSLVTTQQRVQSEFRSRTERLLEWLKRFGASETIQNLTIASVDSVREGWAYAELKLKLHSEKKGIFSLQGTLGGYTLKLACSQSNFAALIPIWVKCRIHPH